MSQFKFAAEILSNHTAVVGKTGSGKTSTTKLMVEQVVKDGFRVCILDPIKSDWWGITSSADGKHPGLPFQILGGPHGHVPLHSSSGKVIGQLVGSGKLPLSIIDMADFEAGGLQKFFVDFSQALMKSARGVIYLVIEEAHEFAPKERSGIGAETVAIHWAKKLATAGRSKGIRLIVATQRTQALHNAVLGSCETMIAHRISAPADQEPISKWLKANTDKDTLEKVMGTLSSLPTGTGCILSGEAKIFEQVKFPKFSTYDNTATPENDSEEVKVKTAPVDQEALRAIIGDAVKEADAKDPSKLIARIKELEKAAHKGLPAPVVQKDLERAKNNGYEKGFNDACIQAEARFSALKICVSEEISKIFSNPDMGGVKSKDFHFSFSEKPDSELNVKNPIVIKKHTSSEGIFLESLVAGKVKLNGPQSRIINSLRFWLSVGNDRPTRAQVAAVAGYSANGGSFGVPASQLSTMGIIGKPSNGVMNLLQDPGGDKIDAKANVLSILDGPQKRLLDSFLQHNPPDVLTRTEVAERAGYSPDGGAFGVPASKLCTLQIFEKPESGKLRLSDWALEVLT